MPTHTLRCSFCRKAGSEVAKLVAGPRVLGIGPRVYVCDACVALSAKIMSESADVAQPGAPRAWLVGTGLRATSCGSAAADGWMLTR